MTCCRCVCAIKTALSCPLGQKEKKKHTHKRKKIPLTHTRSFQTCNKSFHFKSTTQTLRSDQKSNMCSSTFETIKVKSVILYRVQHNFTQKDILFCKSKQEKRNSSNKVKKSISTTEPRLRVD